MRYLYTSLLATVLLAPSFAKADDLFTMTDLSNGQITTFTLPSSPTAITPSGDHFNISAIVDDNGVIAPDTLQFFLGGSPDYGGLGDEGSFNISLSNNVLFQDGVNSPTFLLGTFGESDYGGGNDFSVNISPAVAATPEPASFALLGTGLLGVIGVARRRFKR